MGLSFTISAGPRQRGHSWVTVSGDSWPYFTVSDSTLCQAGGSGPHICIPQEQGGPVIPPGTGFPFRRLLLRLAGLRWMCSNSPPHGVLTHVSHSCSLYIPCTAAYKIPPPTVPFIITCVYVVAETCLFSRCLTTDHDIIHNTYSCARPRRRNWCRSSCKVFFTCRS
jgi:hypothetical protein